MHGLQACLFKYITVAAFHIYLSVVKMLLKGEVGGRALNSHGNYIADHGKIMELFFLNFCGNPAECQADWILIRQDILWIDTLDASFFKLSMYG